MTGAGRGIGRAVALALAAEGAAVGLVARTLEQLEEVRGLVGELGSHARAVPCDVTNAESIRAAVAEVQSSLGPLDILVNSAGDAVSAPLSRTDDALWNHMIAVNLTATFFMIRETAQGMIARGGGRIVNIASVAGLTGAPYIAAYSASKHGVVGLTRALAVELARHGITVNAVCPGYVDTSLTERSVANISDKTGKSPQEARALLEKQSPQKRMITPPEVAALVVHLVSNESQGINGQAIVIDGGGLVS